MEQNLIKYETIFTMCKYHYAGTMFLMRCSVRRQTFSPQIIFCHKTDDVGALLTVRRCPRQHYIVIRLRDGMDAGLSDTNW